jgi:broad specificity phosphatase PhoE
MGSLLLVRHAQASFFGADYDVLSPLGQEQARRLGDYWAALGLDIDAVYAGPRARHLHTAELVGDRIKGAGRTWPGAVVREAFDEHTADSLLREPSVRALRAEHPQLEPLASAYQAAEGPAEIQKSFQKFFEAVVHLWCEGRCEVPGNGAWLEYRNRVWAELAELCGAGPPGQRIAVFTSVGPIAVALGWVLSCPDPVALELGWRLRNCSLTEIVFTRARRTLDGFNILTHLGKPELWTFR